MFRAGPARARRTRVPVLRRAWRASAWLAALAVSIGAGCGRAHEVYDATGTVQGVSQEALQLHVAHDTIPGFMPAMTMSFDVARAELLDGLAPGDRIRFELERTGSLLRVLSVEKTGRAEVAAGRSGRAPVVAESEPAPPFELTDQDGRRFELASLRGHAVVLDFIFTRCAGPCPILTARHAELQRGLDPDLAACTRFVSISVDPEYDRPHVLRAYARARGADLAAWTFLTGDPDEVDAVLARYGVGAVRTDRRNLEHTVATFLIDPEGRVSRRYLGLASATVAQMSEDLRATCG